MNDHIRVVRQAASWCLRYPDDKVRSVLPIIAEALAETGAAPGAEQLRSFVEYARTTPELELAAHYVTVFDLRNRRSLNLTWWSDGDTRRRGMALLAFKDAYRAAGWRFDGDDLPDHLPAVLEFSALDDAAARDAGEELLARHHAGVCALHEALTAARTPYAHVLEAVRTTLPPPRPAESREPERPLLELVGLDAYPAHLMEAGR
ncbi:nitrate reductase molybdenum cofactor assembly chaperone [Catenulispora subtropica]|uniref:Nitrate reductase molybdenum cofactor assembly chaperone n=1 Tax=Catenulispora subtropica TaxID=450798 RepID=A0ABN2SER2_9ACTN